MARRRLSWFVIVLLVGLILWVLFDPAARPMIEKLLQRASVGHLRP
jgi:hypothetical protein